MAKKRKQRSQSEDNLASNPEDKASDAEKIRREDERGRTVLAKVGKAIHSGTKIPVEWHPTRNVPRGDNRTTLSTYIGVVVRERVSINYKKWSDVPKELKNEVCEFIMSLVVPVANLSRSSGKNGASGGHEFGGSNFPTSTGLRKGGVCLNVDSEPSHEVIKPYHVPWPQQSHPNHVQIPEINCDHLPNTELEPNNHDYTFPKGWSECSLAIENNKGVEIVAIGEVEVADASEVIRVHNVRLTNDLRRVKFLQDLVPSAPLPCPTDEFTYVCQAKHSFATWPVHLIFPKTKV
ncbi:hypothetical protein BVRB_5g109850 isoform B [Beta vulgaris subsp. vulgaris]|nr:hypothetical protein BVRB_5g109850 isoform B [Beta vulgaris subsp. vulgaris]